MSSNSEDLTISRHTLLVFCNDYDYFLAHRYALLSELPDEDVDVRAFCGGIGDRVPKLPFPVVPIPCDRYGFRPLKDLRLFAASLLILLRLRPDVVHTITLKPNLIVGLAVRVATVLASKPCRLVMIAPGLGRVFAQSRGGAAARMVRSLVTRGLRIALGSKNSRVAFENDADRQTWLACRIVAANRAILVSGAGVDPDVFRPSGHRAEPPPLRVLFASRLLESKGAGLFVDAAIRVADTGKSVEFVAAGKYDPSEQDSINLEARKLPPNFRHLGHCSDMAALLDSVHVVVLPSTYAEGLPRILLEAAAMGCALVASDIPGCRRIVEDGRSGILLPVVNGRIECGSLVRAIQRLADDPALARRMGEEARALFWARNFDLASVRREIKAILLDRTSEFGVRNDRR